MNDDDLTTDLGRALQGRSEDMHGSSLALADVRQKARSIRRRRTATAVVGAAAAVAVIVPSAALATHQGHRATPLPPATRSVSPSPSPSPTAIDGRQPAKGVLDVSDLPPGAVPQMDYVEDRTLHLTDGSTAEIGTRHTPDGFVEMADGARVWHTTDDNGNAFVEIQDTDGTLHDPVPTTSDLSVNPTHSIVAWLAPSGQVTIWEGWASQPRPLGDPIAGDDLRMGPITGSAEAVPGKPGPDCRQSSCTVIVNVHDGASPPWEVSEAGSQPLRDGGYVDINDVTAAGLTVGLTRVTDSGTCSRLLGSGEFQGFATCQNQLTSFSPDGRLIQAWPSYGDGLGPGGIAIYDLDGNRLFERSSTQQVQSYLASAAWEDDTHVLAAAYQEGTWSLVRIAPDGSMEYAVPPAAAPYEDSPFVLPTGGSLPGA